MTPVKIVTTPRETRMGSWFFRNPGIRIFQIIRAAKRNESRALAPVNPANRISSRAKTARRKSSVSTR